MSELITSHVLRPNKADALALNKAHVLQVNNKICPVFTANTEEATFGRLHKGGTAFGRPPPFVVSFALAVNTWHILVLRRKTCTLLRAKTSAFLRRKTCAVLRARTCALFRANTKETTEGGGQRRRPSVVAAEGRHLCIGSEQSTCPSSQHSTCLASYVSTLRSAQC